MQLFSEKYFSNFEQEKLQKLRQEIESYDSLDESLEEEVASIVEEFKFNPINLETTGYTSRIYMLNVPINRNSGEMSFNGTKDIAVVEYTYNLAVNISEKQKELLPVQPLYHVDTVFKVTVNGHNPKQFQFGIPTKYSRIDLPNEVIDEVVKQRDKVLEAVQTNVSSLNENIIRLNQNIYNVALECTKIRKEHLDKMKEINSKL